MNRELQLKRLEGGPPTPKTPHPAAPKPGAKEEQAAPSGMRRRRRGPRALTMAARRLSRAEVLLGKTLDPPVAHDRPQVRAECRGGVRPCPFVACKYHLYLDVNPATGSLKLNFPDLEVWELRESCALDVAERGGVTLEDVGAIMNLTRERIRQVECRSLRKLKSAPFIAEA